MVYIVKINDTYLFHSHGGGGQVAGDARPVGVGVRLEATTQMVAAAVELRGEAIVGDHVPRVTHVDRELQLDTVEGAVCATAAHGDVKLEEGRRSDAKVPRLGVAHAS